jgi:hypothetical protein
LRRSAGGAPVLLAALDDVVALVFPFSTMHDLQALSGSVARCAY